MDVNSLFDFLGTGLIGFVAFVIALSIVVGVHEFGHYIVGKKFGIFAETFSIGMGNGILWRRDKHGTKWQIAPVPLGGFVRFRNVMREQALLSGEVEPTKDEKSLIDQGKLLSQTDLTPELLKTTIHGASYTAKVATYAAGPVFNFILSFFLFTGLFMASGITSDPLTVGELQKLPTAQELRTGDVVLKIEGIDTPRVDDSAAYSDFLQALPQKPQLDYTVLRDGGETVVSGPYIFPSLVGRVFPRSASVNAGLEKGDVITAVDGAPIFAFVELQAAVLASEGKSLTLTIWRDGQEFDTELTPKKQDEPQPEGGFKTFYRIGLGSAIAFTPASESPGLVDAMSGSASQLWHVISSTGSAVWAMATGQISTCNLSSPVGIAEAAGDEASQGLTEFIGLVAMLSVAIGFLNLLPVPALDGGYILLHTAEILTGFRASYTFLNRYVVVGFIVIIGVMMIGLSSDLFC